jgi:M6 family metalloprotease-like protein
MKRLITVFLLAFLILGFCNVQALTISPQLRDKLIREGAWEAFAKQFQQWQEKLEAATSQDALFKPNATLDANGVSTKKVVVILVDFSDNPASSGSNTTDTASFRDLLFSSNPASPRSLTDFYLENSYGKMVVEGAVFGWYRMPKPYAQYVGTGYGLQDSTPNAQTLVFDALTTADPTINFADYQNASFGVDAVFIVHAGKGAEEGGDIHALWSHRSSTSYPTDDGVTVRSYLVGPEEEFGHQSYVGVYCHEFGHILGLPDLYDVGNTNLAGLGYWSLMASGSWNGNGRWPAHLDAWCKNYLGYGKRITISYGDPNLVNVTLGSSVNDTLRYRILLASGGYKEYFLVENRQQISFDRSLPGSGLLILHCDDNLSGNNDMRQGHWRVAVEQADGLGDLDVGRNDGDARDVFPGPANQYTEFTNLTNPSTASYYGIANQAAVWNITQNTTAKTVTFNLDATFSRANMQLTSKSFNDSVYGNNDGVLMPGEKAQLYYTIKNLWKAVTGVTVKVTSSTPGITLSPNQTSFGNMSVGQVKSDSTAPVEFTMALGMQPTNARFDLAMITTSPPDTFLTTFYKYVGGVEVLLVDDDGGSPIGDATNRESYYKSALDSLNIPYDYWDATHTTLPDTASMYSHHYVIWFTGDNRSNVLNATRVTLLRNYLDHGGRLFLTGQNIAEQLSASTDSTFLRDYLKAGFVGNCWAGRIWGTQSDPIGMGDSVWASAYDGASNQASSDILEVLSGANHPFSYDPPSQGAAATAFASSTGYRVVFFGFGFEAIVNTKTGFAKRQAVMQRVLDFLSSNQATDVDDTFSDLTLPAAFELSQNFPNPFNPVTMIRYEISPKANGQHFALDIYNIIGQKVATLASGIARTGSYTAEFDATTEPSGVYLYRLTVGTETITKKMVLTK